MSSIEANESHSSVEGNSAVMLPPSAGPRKGSSSVMPLLSADPRKGCLAANAPDLGWRSGRQFGGNSPALGWPYSHARHPVPIHDGLHFSKEELQW